jgi:hypothetical protein
LARDKKLMPSHEIEILLDFLSIKNGLFE